MAAKNYNLHLKGFVGGYDFDADYVDFILSRNGGKEVNVLIDSLGGRSNTALSIFSAFKRHGNVNVHFVGMNASAATIASLGARHITMDASAMYLVHQCSIGFFEWGQLNSDGLQTLIENIEKQKADLDKLDANIAQMYAARCHKEAGELLELMKQGGWLNAKEALEWGFVDELTEYEEEEAPVLTDTMATAMAAAGIPIPSNMTRNISPEQSAIARFFNSLASLFTRTGENRNTADTHAEKTITNPQQNMNKIFNNVCKLLQCEHLTMEEDKATLTDAQLTIIESAMEQNRQQMESLQGQVSALETERQSLLTQVEELKRKPADSSTTVVNNQGGGKTAEEEKNDAQLYLEHRSQAMALFNELP